MVCNGKFLLDTRIDMGSIYSVQQVSNCWTKDVPVVIHNPPPPPPTQRWLGSKPLNFLLGPFEKWNLSVTVHQQPSKKISRVSRFCWLLQRKSVKSPIQKPAFLRWLFLGGYLTKIRVWVSCWGFETLTMFRTKKFQNTYPVQAKTLNFI